MLQQLHKPPGVLQGIRDVAWTELERDGKVVVEIAHTLAPHGQVHRDDQRFEPRRLGALQQLPEIVAVLQDIGLKPQTPPGLFGHGFDQGGGAAGQRIGDTRRACSSGQSQLGVRMTKAACTGGRDGHGQLGGLSQNSDIQFRLTHVTQHMRSPGPMRKGLTVGAQGEFLLGAPIKKFENEARQPPARELSQVLNDITVLKTARCSAEGIGAVHGGIVQSNTWRLAWELSSRRLIGCRPGVGKVRRDTGRDESPAVR